MECIGAILIIIVILVVKAILNAGAEYVDDKIQEHQVNKAIDERETLFIKYLAIMSAKIAKADGEVSDIEIANFFDAFRRLRLSEYKLSVCKESFQKGIDSDASIFYTAKEFHSNFPEREISEVLYAVLAHIALADEIINKNELDILREMPGYLGLSDDFFYSFCNSAQIDPDSKYDQRVGSYKQKSEIDPYEVLGTTKDASNETLKKTYREKVRNYHPDVLRGQGVPEEMLSFANEEMAKINEAWAQIKEERHIY